MTRVGWLLLIASLPLVAARCAGSGNGADAGSDTDADSDSDLDAGSDAGPDSSADADTDTDTGPGDSAVIVTAGGRHTCALVEGGYLKCWGDWHFGQLGYGSYLYDNPSVDLSSPSTLPFIEIGGMVERVDGGGLHTCALLNDGTVKCWGSDEFGQLGVEVPPENGDTLGLIDVPADYEPVEVGGAVIQLSTGGSHTCVLLGDGGVKCWGDNGAGQLGDGNGGINHVSYAPVVAQVGGLVSQVSAGARHTCAVLESGNVVCWGQGQYGALGYGNTDDVGDDEVPADVGPVDLGGAAVQVSCGGYHTCALLESGEVVCWGLGDYGALGYGNSDTIGDDEVPAEVGPVDVGAPVVEITTGDRYVCAVLEEGGVKCWGSSGAGALGYGNEDDIGDDETPADVGTVEIGEPIVHIDATYAHTCALAQSGAVYCWGQGAWGQLGYGNEDDIGDNETPADIGPVQFF